MIVLIIGTRIIKITNINIMTMIITILMSILMPEESNELVSLNSALCQTDFRYIQGCVSRTPLDPEAEALCFRGNDIDDACARVLVYSLLKNSRLKLFDLSDNSGITAQGWKAFLCRMYGTRSTDCMSASKHTFCSLSERTPLYFQCLIEALGRTF